MKNGWQRFYIRCYGDFYPSARERCPRTAELLEGLPNVHLAAFTMVPPHGKLKAHRDPFAVSLR